MQALLGEEVPGLARRDSDSSVKILDIFGSTGSVGQSGLEIVGAFPDRFELNALVAGSNCQQLIEQAREFRPKILALRDLNLADQLKEAVSSLDYKPQLLFGEDQINTLAKESPAHIQLAAISGMAGLSSVLAALRSGKRVALANKESIVVGSELLADAIKRGKGEIIPVDSEHSALFQCLIGRPLSSIRSLVLTCSGGPFLRSTPAELSNVTPELACAHPRWNMGRKISVDSSTLMNKALEMIEAARLFGVGLDDIQVVIHPQSIVHSLVEFCDGSLLAQLSSPDMKSPVAFALEYPGVASKQVVQPMDFQNKFALSFEPPDESRFGALKLARQAIATGVGACFALNLANEIAVEAFLNNKLQYLQIVPFCEQAIEQFSDSKFSNEIELVELSQQVSVELEEMVRIL